MDQDLWGLCVFTDFRGGRRMKRDTGDLILIVLEWAIVITVAITAIMAI